MEFKLSEIARYTGGRLVGNDIACRGISIDTRKISKGEVYVAIKGAHFDGHSFVGDAVKRGAAALIVSDSSCLKEGSRAVVVADTEKALGDVAMWWMSKFDIPRIAVTGSNGKSTTKEMIYAIVSSIGPVLKTEGNFNNLIGLPLTIFRVDSGFKLAILEMGMNAPGEIKRLTEIARPTVGLITNVTAAHLEKLHSVDAVAKAKGELFDAMGEGAIAIVNMEDTRVKRAAMSHKGPRITFGMQNECDVRFLSMETNGLDKTNILVSVLGREVSIDLPVPGAHNVMNALAAMAVSVALKIDPQVAASRFKDFRPMAMRFERIQLSNGVRMVNDSYNANPESMKAAFRTVGAAKRAGRFIAVLGDMLELGEASPRLHEEIGEEAAKLGVERMYVAGNFASSVAKGAISAGLGKDNILVRDDVEGIGEELMGELRPGDVLLVKGSRGMRMERVVMKLKDSIGTD
jgi:UDP-N-acetylmuramoyl-tripeptide--D-alanyl-D-alanine ligase